MNRLNVLAWLALLLVSLPCSGKPPQFVRDESFSCKDTADAVNYYVDLGEAEAIREMRATVDDAEPHARPSLRICHLCRVLFEPKGKEPLRSAALGGLDLPRNTMPINTWPRFPVAESGSTFFLLNESYELGGRAERPSAYLDYCVANGVFRRNRVAVPTRDGALQDLNQLRRSDAWKAIRWKDSGVNWSYTLSEAWTLGYLKAQAERTPAK
jgi:hypothetical protein